MANDVCVSQQWKRAGGANRKHLGAVGSALASLLARGLKGEVSRWSVKKKREKKQRVNVFILLFNSWACTLTQLP